MVLTLVIPTFNSAHCIRECIGSAVDSLGRCQVVVVDNGSSDQTCSLARQAGVGSAVEVVELGRNTGFGTASNEGIRRADGDLILLLNPDARISGSVESETLEELAAGWRGLGTVVFDVDSDHTLHLVRERPWWVGVWRVLLLPYKPRGLRERRFQIPVGSRWITGAGLLLRKDEFLSVGGFDESFFMYAEDRDLCRRYREAGLPVRGGSPLHGSHARGQSSELPARQLPERFAWAILSWIEYAERKAGPGQAAAAARTVTAGARLLAVVSGWIGEVSRSSRFIDKSKQMKACLSYIERWQRHELPDSDPLASPDFYPAARLALSGQTEGLGE